MGLETTCDPIQTVFEANFHQCCGINTLGAVFMGRNNKEEPKRAPFLSEKGYKHCQGTFSVVFGSEGRRGSGLWHIVAELLLTGIGRGRFYVVQNGMGRFVYLW